MVVWVIYRPTEHHSWFAVWSRCSWWRWMTTHFKCSSATSRRHQAPAKVSFITTVIIQGDKYLLIIHLKKDIHIRHIKLQTVTQIQTEIGYCLFSFCLKTVLFILPIYSLLQNLTLKPSLQEYLCIWQWITMRNLNEAWHCHSCQDTHEAHLELLFYEEVFLLIISLQIMRH